jgi:hypothetical protein
VALSFKAKDAAIVAACTLTKPGNIVWKIKGRMTRSCNALKSNAHVGRRKAHALPA